MLTSISRGIFASVMIFATQSVALSQSDDYGPPFPVVANGGSITHNGWTLDNASSSDYTNALRYGSNAPLYTFSHNGQDVLKFTVDIKYSTGPVATQVWAASGWSLSNGGNFLQTYGRGIAPPEWQWSLGTRVIIVEERFWGIDLKAKHEEVIPGHGVQTNFFGLSGFDWMWAMGKRVELDVTGEPEYWE